MLLGDVGNVSQVRKRRHRDGELEFQCFCSKHNGQWLEARHFTFSAPDKRSNKYPRRFCKWGEQRANGVSPLILTSKLFPFLAEVIHRCGEQVQGSTRKSIKPGIHASAIRTLGMSKNTFYRIFYQQTEYTQNAVAEVIFKTLIGLRDGTIVPSPIRKRGPVKGSKRGI